MKFFTAKMAVFLDASYFLALISKSDVHHAKAARLAEELKTGKYGALLTSDHVFDEAISVMLRKNGKNEAVLLGKQIMASVSILVADYHVLEYAWQIFVKTNLNFSFTDCTNLVFMKMASTDTIVTFDKEFEKIKDVKLLV